MLAYLMLIIVYFFYKTYKLTTFFYLNFFFLINMNINFYLFIEKLIVKPKLEFYKNYFFKKFYHKKEPEHFSKESNKKLVLSKINQLSSSFAIDNKDKEFKYFINEIQTIEFEFGRFSIE